MQSLHNPIDRCRHDAACIAGTFAAWIKPRQPGRLSVVIAQQTNGRRRTRFDGGQHRIRMRKSMKLLVKAADSICEVITHKGWKNSVQIAQRNPGTIGGRHFSETAAFPGRKEIFDTLNRGMIVSSSCKKSLFLKGLLISVSISLMRTMSLLKAGIVPFPSKSCGVALAA